MSGCFIKHSVFYCKTGNDGTEALYSMVRSTKDLNRQKGL